MVVGAAVLVVALVAVGGYVYFFSGARNAPKPLALTTATPTAGAGSATATSLAGNWTVATGSTAGYRATELFAGQTANHEAVARTSQVGGTLAIAGSSAALQATNVNVTVQLANLKSEDTVAGRDVAQRDQTVQRTLNTSSYPTATLTVPSVQLPAGAAAGGQVSVPAQGNLTIHGVTKAVELTLQAQLTGGRIEAVGTIPVTMTDYGIQAPNFPFVTVQPNVQLEFQVFFTKGT